LTVNALIKSPISVIVIVIPANRKGKLVRGILSRAVCLILFDFDPAHPNYILEKKNTSSLFFLSLSLSEWNVSFYMDECVLCASHHGTRSGTVANEFQVDGKRIEREAPATSSARSSDLYAACHV
jgi:hypothetical protein